MTALGPSFQLAFFRNVGGFIQERDSWSIPDFYLLCTESVVRLPLGQKQPNHR
jgi:hypothetical protein